MALRPRSPGETDKKYVSVVSAEEFNTYQQNGYHDDEDIDFTPQNGYLEPEDMDTEDNQVASKGKKAGAPKMDLMGKIVAAGSAIKNARLPSPGEIKEGYLNSAFHKSFHQPLMVKSKVEKIDVQKARQAITQEKTPSQLGNIESISDFPVPTIRKSKGDKTETEEEGSGITIPKNMEEFGQAAYNTIPRSWREQNIITAVKENLDPEELERNQTLTKTKTPAELAQINSISEFPVPDRIKNLLAFERKEAEKKEPKKRRHSDCEPEVTEPFTLYSTLPRSLRETKLITNVKVEEDEEVLKSRQALVESKSPVELSTITSLSDLPLPSKITRMMNRTPAASTPGSKLDVSSKSSTKGLSKMNINDMYSTLPKSLTMELAVTTKVNKNPEEVERRMKLTQEKTPTELGNIGSLADLPIPSALQNIFGKSDAPDAPDAPEKPQRKNIEEKRKRNLTTGAFLSGDFLPESWRETKLLVRTKVEEDGSVLKSRQELVESKSPTELGQINGFSDLPIPTGVQTLLRSKKRVLKSTEEKELSKKSGSAQSLPTMSSFMTIPSSLKSELLVKSKVEDPDIVARNKETIKNKSVSELSQIRDLSDFPIPDGIENFFKQNPVKNNVDKSDKMSDSASERPTSPQSFKESIYETLPRSMREQQLLVKSKVEDEEKVRERQELIRTKSPTELSQISSISDLPIPAPVENLLKKKSEPESPIAPPRKWKKEDIYESIPSSLKSELIVSQIVEDPAEVEQRKELIRTHTPAQLSEINSISEFPIPKCIENLVSKTESTEKKTEEEEAEKEPFSIEKLYPASLMETKLLVKAETEDPEVQAARAEIVKSKSVNELSQITSLSDIPIPDVIENFVRRSYAPTERKKKFKERIKSQSTQSLSQSMYSTLPRSLKQDLLVKSRIEEPDILAERRAIVASKSVSELSQITSISDIPIPTTLSRAFHKSMEMLSGLKTPKQEDDESEIRPITPGARSITENMYASLPRSLKSELLVKTCVEDPEIQQERKALTESKSVSELSQIKSLSDIPIPENIEKLISRTATNKTESPEQQSLDSRPVSRGSRSIAGFKEDMYASLPRSLKDQLIVRTKVEENEEVLHQRQALVESKSPAELSEIHSLGELPIPSRIEAWLHGSNPDTERTSSAVDESPMTLPRTKKEFQEAMYRTLPQSLTQPCVVRSKVEDPNILIERQQLQQTKSIHELSKIRNLNEVPIPGNLVTLPDVPLPKIKNILNYIARPAQKTPKTPNGTKSETYHSYESAQSETVESTPLTEDKVFHSMSNGNESPSGSLSNDKELGYEVISKTPEVPQIIATPPEEFKVQPQIVERTPTPPPPEEEEDHFSLADQIKGTPERSMRNKKKKNRRSHEVHDEVMSVDSSVVSESIASEEIPPPLPPKRVTPSPKKGMSLESQPSMEEEEIEAIPVKNKLNTTGEGLDVPGPLPPKRDKQSASVEPREITEKITPEVEERIQSRPLPPPPAPPRTLKKKSTSLDEADGRTSQSSEASFKDVHEGTSTETENFRTCAESLNNSKTMRESSAQSTRTEDDDFTLADSVVDSLVSCAETLVGDNENLETCADTLTGGEQEYFSDDDIDNPYPSVDFDSMTAQGPGAGANIVEEERPGRSALKKSEVAKSESGRRLEEGTQQLSIELMEHVESLKTTLDNMSSRLGTRSRSRSQSKSRPASTFKDSL